MMANLPSPPVGIGGGETVKAGVEATARAAETHEFTCFVVG